MRTSIAVLAVVGSFVVVTATGCAQRLEEIDASVTRALSAYQSPARDRSAGTLASAPAMEGETADINSDSTLGECLRYAAANSPDLLSAFLRWQAALERVPQVTALPDPRASYGYFLNEVETRVGPQQHRFGVSQTFPWFGKLDLRGNIAAEAANMEYERLQGERLNLAERVKAAYHELAYLRQSIALTEENLQILERAAETAQNRYRVGEESQSDLLRVEVELIQVEDRLEEFRARRRPLTARLNSALNRTADAPGPWPASIADVDPSIDPEQLARTLADRSPALSAMDRKMERSRIEAELAYKAFYPDITVSLDYIVTGSPVMSSINEAGDDAVMAGFSLNLPIWRSKYEAGVREAFTNRLALAAQKAGVELSLIAALEQSVFDVRDARRRHELLLSSLLPKAEESLRTALSGYETGNVTFTDLLDAERVLLELQLLDARAMTDAAIATARIEALINDDLTTRTENRP